MLRENFRPSASGSGLLVPEDVSREREVWTRDECKLLDRAMALLEKRGVKFLFKCADPKCSEERMERLQGDGKDFTIRCGHKDRIFQRAI